MKRFLKTVLIAIGIAAISGSVGLVRNMVFQKPLPWVYEPPKEIVVAGLKVPLVDEREAHRFLGDGSTVFVDSRKCPDYATSHVKGAICLPPHLFEDRFPGVEPLIPADSRVILYCYGPECDMAEKVAENLGHLGYSNMMIMSAGFRAWEKAGYPVDRSVDREPSA